MDISFITGGISNALFKVSAPAAAAAGGVPAAAFRIYGDSTEQFIDRNHELGIMRLAHQHGFGPQVRDRDHTVSCRMSMVCCSAGCSRCLPLPGTLCSIGGRVTLPKRPLFPSNFSRVPAAGNLCQWPHRRIPAHALAAGEGGGVGAMKLHKCSYVCGFDAGCVCDCLQCHFAL